MDQVSSPKEDSLDVMELFNMFKKYKINIDVEKLKKLFNIVDKDQTGELDLDEFKQFATDLEANKQFKVLINHIWGEQQFLHPEERADILPTNFSLLLNILADKSKKEEIRNLIQDPERKVNYSSKIAAEDFKHWVQLFKADNEKKNEMINPDNDIVQKLRFKKKFLEIEQEIKDKEGAKLDLKKRKSNPIKTYL